MTAPGYDRSEATVRPPQHPAWGDSCGTEAETQLGLAEPLQEPVDREIPAEAALGQLSSLDRLYLHRNQLTGSLPVELGDLGSLKNPRLKESQLDRGRSQHSWPILPTWSVCGSAVTSLPAASSRDWPPWKTVTQTCWVWRPVLVPEQDGRLPDCQAIPSGRQG